MAYEPLHHKYRPQTFAELVGQEAIATTLTNALQQQKIAPAYLFTGARGTGKTSSARILAKSLNCLKSTSPTAQPCGLCEVCRSIARGSALDVIEIDAASNTGVDNIRELIERSQFAPVQCRYKVYVIDECHMLSTAAFNALLKTLEEPPDRVVFILATTDPQRVLPTIISRCQRFDFRRIELAAMVEHLGRIADKEAIDIIPGAIQLVAQIAQGGLRDAESMLDQLSLLEGQITAERVWDLVGAVPERDLLALVQALIQSDATAAIERVRHLMDRGREPLIVLQNLASFYRDLLIAKTSPDRNDLVAITPPTWAEMCQLVQTIDFTAILAGQKELRKSEPQVKNTTQPRLWLEVTLLELLAVNSRVGVSGQSAELRLQVDRQALKAASAVSPPLPSRPAGPSVASLSQELPRPPKPNPPEPSIAPDPANTSFEAAEQETAEPEEPLAAIPKEPLVPTGIAASKSQIDLEQMWQSVVEVLQPPGTQALFKQQGRLLALEAASARVGISSQPLFKMAQQRIANLEAAFNKLTQQSIRVSLEVVLAVAPPSASSEPGSEIPSQPSVHSGSSPVPVAQSIVREPARNGNSAVSESAPAYSAAEPSQPTVPVVPPPISPPTPSLPSSPPTLSTPQPWQEEDEVSRAAKSLAQMFNGQIVSGTDEVPTSSTEIVTLAVPDLEVEDGDPDGDVPF